MQGRLCEHTTNNITNLYSLDGRGGETLAAVTRPANLERQIYGVSRLAYPALSLFVTKYCD